MQHIYSDHDTLCDVLQNFVLHWEHTHDLLWLKTTGFPFLRENFALYQCLLER